MQLQLFTIGLLLSLVPAKGETAAISGPVLGYAATASKISPIIGVPGAAYFANGIDTHDLRIAAISSEQSYALVLTPNRQAIRLLSLRDAAAPEETTIAAFESTIDAVAVSPSGTAAALLRRSEGRIDIVAGLPERPVLKTLPIESPIARIAVADDGGALAISQTNVVWRVDAAGLHQLATGEDIREIRFRPRSHDLLVADGAANQVVLFGTFAKVLANSADGLATPSQALFSRDGHLVFIANTSTNEMFIVEPAGGRMQRVSLPCQPSDVEPLSTAALRFSCETDASMHLLQVMPEGARVLFVPNSAK